MAAADHRALAERFFAALAAGDADGALACCAEGCTFVRNDVGVEQQMGEQLRSLLGALGASGTTIAYDDPVRHATDRGFVEEHTVVVTLGAGTVSMRTAVIADVDAAGRISSMREYLDPAPLSRLGRG